MLRHGACCIALHVRYRMKLAHVREVKAELLSVTLVMRMQELAQHPFWQTELQSLEMPPEPALQEFVRRYNLAPADNGTSTSSKVGVRRFVQVW